MGNLNRRIRLSLVALAAVFLLKPSPGFADDANGLPTPPPGKTGIEGEIQDVTINGMTFKQGRQVTSIFVDDYVSVDVEIYSPEGMASQRHTTIQYRWFFLPDGDNKQLTETITVKSTLENKNTGKTTTDRDDSYKVETDWERAGTTYTLHLCDATSGWNSDTGSSGNFAKHVRYFNEPADDGNSFVKHRVLSVTTDYNEVDPFWGGWSFSRFSFWDIVTGNLTRHRVSINGADQQNPFAWPMVEGAIAGGAMDPLINDPSIPALSGVPFEWPQEPPFV